MKKTQKNYQRKRIAVYRSNQHIYAQVIDDVKGTTLISASDHEIKSATEQKSKSTKQKTVSKIEKAQKVGELLAQKAKTKKIGKAYFDRRQYKYHGRVKALAQGARKGGLTF